MGSKDKGKRYSETEIIKILKELESGTELSAVSRKHGVAEGTIYRWKSRYGGLEHSDLQRMRELEKENSRLRKIVADQAMDIDVLKELNSKKW